MCSVTADGSRVDQLRELAKRLAVAIDTCESPRELPSLARQYRETIRELEEIGEPDADDGLLGILSRRGKQ
jgi:hypothetical protein